MLVVGIDDPNREEAHVHTIDLWFSRRLGVWVVERLNASGDVIGHPHHCANARDAAHCLQEWLRSHGETHLVTPREAPAAATRTRAVSHPKRHAA